MITLNGQQTTLTQYKAQLAGLQAGMSPTDFATAVAATSTASLTAAQVVVYTLQQKINALVTLINQQSVICGQAINQVDYVAPVYQPLYYQYPVGYGSLFAGWMGGTHMGGDVVAHGGGNSGRH
jgi:hypothetical protein